MLFGLVVLSIPYVRHRFYEAFYHVHILLAVCYVGLMFWHSGNLGDSWAYLWATIAVWLASILARLFYFNRAFNIRNQWIVGSPTRLHALPGNMTRIDVLAPHKFSWRPGQHCFLRFPSVSIFDNHPFTIANSCTTIQGLSKPESLDGDRPSMTFFVRSHSGFTQKLSKYIKANVDSNATAWIDGPYGGIVRKVENAYDTVILVAGGAGITACLPWVQYVSSKMTLEAVRTTRMVLIWAVHESEHLEWVAEELSDVKNTASAGKVEMAFYITGSAPDFDNQSNDSPTEKALEEMIGKEVHIPMDPRQQQSSNSSRRGIPGTHHRGRPVLAEVIPSMITSPRSLVIGACSILQLARQRQDANRPM